MYLTIKVIHLACALFSISGFLLRSYLMFIGSPWLKHKAVLVIPHLIDSIFLFSGFSMAFMVNFGLFSQSWLTMKIFMLMFYLFFVGVALNRGTTKKIRVLAFFLGISTFGFIVGVAINKTPMSWFALLS
jgi:uncharacterized membrane protein SirB2